MIKWGRHTETVPTKRSGALQQKSKKFRQNVEGEIQELIEVRELKDIQRALLVSVVQSLLSLRSQFRQVRVSNNKNSNRHRLTAARKGHRSVADQKAQCERRTELRCQLPRERLAQSTFDRHPPASFLYKGPGRQYLLPYRPETATRYRE